MEIIEENSFQVRKEKIEKLDLKTTVFMAAVIFLLIGNLTMIYNVYGKEAIISVVILSIIILLIAIPIFLLSRSYGNKNY